MTNEERKALVERLEEWEWTLRAAYKGGDLGTDEPALVMGEASTQIEADGRIIASLREFNHELAVEVSRYRAKYMVGTSAPLRETK